MRRFPVVPAALIGLLAGAIAAEADRVLFTTRTPWTSPVLVSDPAASKEFGFKSVVVRNTSSKAVETVDLRVVLRTAESAEEEVDGGRIHVALEPGQSRHVDVYLGQIGALEQKARSLRLDAALTVLSVASADFADGTRWNGEDTASPIDAPVDAPARPRK